MSNSLPNPLSTFQEQYFAMAKQSQDAATAVVGAWTRSLQDSSIKVPSAAGQAVVHQMIDQMFDFASTVINIQRRLSKELVSSSAAVAEDVAHQATDVAQQATDVANKAAVETAAKVTKVARRTAKSA
jgi:hypothetical protein